MPSKKEDDVPDFLARIPMTFRDYQGEVEPSEPVVVTTVLLPAPEVPVVTDAAKPAKKEN